MSRGETGAIASGSFRAPSSFGPPPAVRGQPRRPVRGAGHRRRPRVRARRCGWTAPPRRRGSPGGSRPPVPPVHHAQPPRRAPSHRRWWNAWTGGPPAHDHKNGRGSGRAKAPASSVYRRHVGTAHGWRAGSGPPVVRAGAGFARWLRMPCTRPTCTRRSYVGGTQGSRFRRSLAGRPPGGILERALVPRQERAYLVTISVANLTSMYVKFHHDPYHHSTPP